MKVFNKLFRKQKDNRMEERLSSSLTELSEKMSSIEKEMRRIDEKINLLEEQNENQTLVNYGLMKEVGLV